MWVPFGTGVRVDQRHNPSGLLDVFAEAVRDKNLSFSDQWAWRIHDVLEEPQEAGTYQEQGYRAVQEVYASQPLHQAPDGLVVLNDLMARGALAGFQELGLRVGQDVKLACHSNKDSNVLLGYESQLIRLQVDTTMLTTSIFETLETLMTGGTPSEFLRRIDPIVLRPELVKPTLQPLQTKTVSTPLAASI
jgi:DNA-binding LacI/PurR family transcriptional regulator